MLPGPTIIRECPHCKSPFKEWTMASGNTLGAQWWTDGKMEASMLPNRNSLVACPVCVKPVWIDEAKELARLKPVGYYAVEREEVPEESLYKDMEDQLEYSDSPTAEVYKLALNQPDLDADKKRYIRFRLWWLWNDARRETGVASALSDQEIENLEKLIPMLDISKQNGLLAKAEVFRELGRFDECIALIDSPEARTENGYAGNILYWAEQRDPYVREIQELSWDFVRSGWEQLKKQQPPFEIDPSGPPVFKIDSDSWWVKVLGMLQHNWALVEETDEGKIVAYFAHDAGIHKGPSPYKYKQLKNRVAIVDSLEFDCWVDAWAALHNNGFEHADEAGENIYLSTPVGVLYDARATEPGVYSKQGYWKGLK